MVHVPQLTISSSKPLVDFIKKNQVYDFQPQLPQDKTES